MDILACGSILSTVFVNSHFFAGNIMATIWGPPVFGLCSHNFCLGGQWLLTFYFSDLNFVLSPKSNMWCTDLIVLLLTLCVPVSYQTNSQIHASNVTCDTSKIMPCFIAEF